MRKVLRDAKSDKAGVHGVVMVGGSTRMPMVQRAVGDFFGQTPLTDLNPDEVVALGAAIQAHALAGNAGAGHNIDHAESNSAIANATDGGASRLTLVTMASKCSA